MLLSNFQRRMLSCLYTGIHALIFACTLLCTSAFAQNLSELPASVRDWIIWETQFNDSIYVRSPNPVPIKHLLVPIELANSFFDSDLPGKIRTSLTVVKNGKTFVKWFVHPEDQFYSTVMINELKSKGVDTTLHSEHVAYPTASRSYVIHDSKTGALFSVKVSTNHVGERPQRRPLTVQDADSALFFHRYMKLIEGREGFEHVALIKEDAIFGHKGTFQGMQVRNLEPFLNGNRRYIPLFSLENNPELVKELAAKNGYSDSKKFLQDHLIKPLARAQTELLVKAGVSVHSSHAQNYLLEVDENLKPTGKVALRDYGDAYIHDAFYNLNKLKWVLPRAESLIEKIPGVSFFFRQLPGYEGSEWEQDFMKEVDAEFKRTTGLDYLEVMKTGSESEKRFFKQAEGKANGFPFDTCVDINLSLY